VFTTKEKLSEVNEKADVIQSTIGDTVVTSDIQNFNKKATRANRFQSIIINITTNNSEACKVSEFGYVFEFLLI
jgi:hypothetical protein